MEQDSISIQRLVYFRYDEDGALHNFIRDTETNASCPCVESQARMDLGRFMPHPRCSQVIREIIKFDFNITGAKKLVADISSLQDHEQLSVKLLTPCFRRFAILLAQLLLVRKTVTCQLKISTVHMLAKELIVTTITQR